MIETRYLVMRTYSHTDRKQLFKVMSRPIQERRSAEFALDVHRALNKGRNTVRTRKYKYFIMEGQYNTETGEFI